ncbi:MAG: type I 3-dehydroquinate dehydratase [Vulcanisaeta sp. AZ3]|jgi:3-dehydroquinate dehydratase-1|nr:MAG: 3-dehydroquinate dehydratase [Vulcanisaeta sp. AZ3]
MSTWGKLLLNKPILVCAMPVRRLTYQYLPASCEAVELRLDYMDDLEPSQELKRFIEDYVSHYPTIVTVREYSEGGNRIINPNIKHKVLSVSREVGALVDIEASLLMNNPSMFEELAENSIVSRHVFKSDINFYELVTKDIELAKRYRAFMYKIFTVNENEILNLLDLMRKVDINMAVIPRNPIHRVISIMMGTPIMYCSVKGKTGPGQLNIGTCSKIKLLRRSLLTLGTE